jgi:hypothetical protein
MLIRRVRFRDGIVILSRSIPYKIICGITRTGSELDVYSFNRMAAVCPVEVEAVVSLAT